MDTRTGDIVPMSRVQDLRDKGDRTSRFYKEIPDVLLPEIQGMNREQRRQWWRKNKKRIKEGGKYG